MNSGFSQHQFWVHSVKIEVNPASSVYHKGNTSWVRSAPILGIFSHIGSEAGHQFIPQRKWILGSVSTSSGSIQSQWKWIKPAVYTTKEMNCGFSQRQFWVHSVTMEVNPASSIYHKGNELWVQSAGSMEVNPASSVLYRGNEFWVQSAPIQSIQSQWKWIQPAVYSTKAPTSLLQRLCSPLAPPNAAPKALFINKSCIIVFCGLDKELQLGAPEFGVKHQGFITGQSGSQFVPEISLWCRVVV